MRKEIIFAILTGIIVGTVVTYGIYIANKSLSDKLKGINPETNNIPIPSSIPEPEMSLKITNPENGLVISVPTVSLEGETLKNSIVTISTEDDDFIVEADDNGLFSQEITLLKGANTLKITSTNFSKTSETVSLNLVYSTEFTKPETETSQEKSTDSNR